MIHKFIKNAIRFSLRILSIWGFLGLNLAQIQPTASQMVNSPPVHLLFDTDIGPDCDDAGALAILHAMADLGEVQLLGMACCTSSEWGAPCLAAINTYYGRPDLPVGTLKEEGFLSGSPNEQYNKYIAQNFPNSLKSGNNAPEAVKMYRQILAAQPDSSVVFVAVGPLRNIRRLLESPVDEYSSLNGVELVNQKVKQLVCMGGAYPSGNEWNFTQDIEATRIMLEQWPTPIVFSGFEIGSAIMTGKRLRTETPETNPVRKAYQLYSGTQADGSRNSWDLTAALFAVRSASDYWKVRTDGSVQIDARGNDKWTATPDRNHGYLQTKMPVSQLVKVIEDLLVQPPKVSQIKQFEKLDSK